MRQHPQELATFCEAEYPRLVGALSLYCGDGDMAEDLAQEALARVCANWSKVKNLGAPAAWAHRVGINLANSYFRRKAIERKATRLSATPQVTNEPDSAESIALRQAVSRLPRRQRTALILRFYADLSVADVAQAMECSEGTVKAHVSKAVANLRRQPALGEEEEITDVI